MTISLYGSPLSLYTGRARSYLIKAGLSYRETVPTSSHFKNNVLPQMGGRQSVPVIETDDGEVIRDGAAIIDYFEDKSGHCFSPLTPKQRIISRLFDVIGPEGLLRPAMHYRWNFPDENLDFLQFHFETFVPPHLDRQTTAAKTMDRMRHSGRNFGAVPDTFEMIESLYGDLLEKLNAHFSVQPYLLGGKPCIGDFGMIAPLYGHLGRDPKPLSMMQSKAIQLFRWVERMNRPEPDLGEFENKDEQYLPDDQIPVTLIELLKQIAVDFVPETKAACTFINEWIEQQEILEPYTVAERGVGKVSFEIAGVPIEALAQPYRFYLLKRVQDEFESLSDEDRQQVIALLEDCNMKDILELKLSRNISRKDNREVWM